MNRQIAYAALTDTAGNVFAAALANLVPAERIRSAGGATEGTETQDIERPFIVIRELADGKPFTDSEVRVGGVAIYVHDQPESYVLIDQCLGLVSAIMNSVAGSQVSSWWLNFVEDQGWSDDLYDDHYETATRFGTYRMGARPA